MEVSVDNDIKEIARMIIEVNEMAYSAINHWLTIYVQDRCLNQVEHLLDYMVGICNDDRMTELFKRVCRKYLYLYPK